MKFPTTSAYILKKFSKLCTLWNSDHLASYRLRVQSSCSSCRTGTIWQRSPCLLALGSGRLACACRHSWSIRWPDPWTPLKSPTEADRPVPWINSSHPPYPPTTEIKNCVYLYVKVFHLTDHLAFGYVYILIHYNTSDKWNGCFHNILSTSEI